MPNGPKEKFPRPLKSAPQGPARKGFSPNDRNQSDLPHAPKGHARPGFNPGDGQKVPPAPQVPPVTPA